MKTTFYTLLMFIGLTSLVRAADEREAFREAMDACFTETGVSKPERGSRPSEEDRAKVDACLSAKGIAKPEHHRRH